MNETILKELIEHRTTILSFIRALVRNNQDTEDVFQETALIIIKAAAADKKVEYFKTWSFEIARRKTLEYMRKNNPKRELQLPSEKMEELIFKVSSNHLSDTDRVSEQYNALLSCLRETPEKNRDMVRLRFREDRTVDDIAKALNKTASAVYKALTTIRLSLAECVKHKINTAGKES